MCRGRVVAVASAKGGVGKTTLSLNLAYALARRGWKTLVIDADPQGGIALSTGESLSRRAGLVEVLDGSTPLARAVVQTREQNLALLPFGELAPMETLSWSSGLEDGTSLRALTRRAAPDFDAILIDTAPGMTGLTLGVLRAADHVLVPLQAEPLAARSVQQLLHAMAALRAEGQGPQLAGLVLTMLLSRHDVSLGVAQESWNLFPQELVFEATIPRDPLFLSASAAGVPIALLHRRAPAVASVFDHLAAELEDRIGLITGEDDGAIPLLD